MVIMGILLFLMENIMVSTGMSMDSNPNYKSYLKNVLNTLQKGIL